MEVEVDARKCCAAGMCALTAPEVFDQDEAAGTVVLLAARPPQAAWESVWEAADSCPAGAITVRD
ncbi:ferredoxin [Phytomonospora sp. NPDC050363]|uniref:ferredoxin n=1 Tax=Phytomonospora sp. NPDC050363 TaxID=3155642 RepID=UPI0033F28484